MRSRFMVSCFSILFFSLSGPASVYADCSSFDVLKFSKSEKIDLEREIRLAALSWSIRNVKRQKLILIDLNKNEDASFYIKALSKKYPDKEFKIFSKKYIKQTSHRGVTFTSHPPKFEVAEICWRERNRVELTVLFSTGPGEGSIATVEFIKSPVGWVYGKTISESVT